MAGLGAGERSYSRCRLRSLPYKSIGSVDRIKAPGSQYGGPNPTLLGKCMLYGMLGHSFGLSHIWNVKSIPLGMVLGHSKWNVSSNILLKNVIHSTIECLTAFYVECLFKHSIYNVLQQFYIHSIYNVRNILYKSHIFCI